MAVSAEGPVPVFRAHLLTFALVALLASRAEAQGTVQRVDTVVVQHGALELRALLWRPAGRGPFPAVLFNHGSGPTAAPLAPQRVALGAHFARHGYVFLYLYRRGAGLSASQGANSFDLMRRALAREGREARNRLQMQLLEGDDLGDAVAGLAFLRALPAVDTRRVAVAGHSFGGSLALVLAERDTAVRAAVVFGAAAGSWDGSPALRERLTDAVTHTRSPVFFVYAANDYSVAPAKTLAAAMKRAGKRHRMKIYPPLGRTADVGHGFVYRAVRRWEPDVFAFLDAHVRR